MNFETANLPNDPAELKRLLVETQRRYERETALLREQVRLLYAKLFGKKSEKDAAESGVMQLPLFDMPEPEVESVEEVVEVPEHTRAKRGRKPLPANLPRVEIVHDIPENAKVCGCGAELDRIGEDVSEKLDIIPAVIQVVRHIRPKYACKSCEGLETEGAVVKIAPPPKQIINKGIATAGLLAHIVTAKFCDALPFYRQERQFARLGAELPRATMANWAMKAANSCTPLLELLWQKVHSGPLINIDETSVQVLAEPGRSPTSKSYMWICRGGDPHHPGLLYHYAPSRSARIAKELLDGYQGAVQSDGYAAYDFLDAQPGIAHAGCWAHVRRKFVDVQKGRGKTKKTGSTDVALNYIRKLYGVEKEGTRNKLSGMELLAFRRKKAKPVLDDFFLWLSKKAGQVAPKSLLGAAVNYTLNQWQRLLVYLDFPDMTPDNNAAENAIRPFVVGRKNWLFAGTQEGAKASATLYSLVETAKANNLEPYNYLRYLFEKLPFAESRPDLLKLLPMNLQADDLRIDGTMSGV
ncbi:IS66 family transposase [Desulfosediminicola ganghwensis]|uniref:IS66 family transposase n=1 Tax=Desulfosediminicola ganghwensis TaxID=2569540 RepID=UPI003B8383A7